MLTSAMFVRTSFTILAVILLAGHTISAPGGKHGSRVNKPASKRPAVKGGNKGGGKGGGNSPAAQQTTNNNRHSLPLDILPYHYTVSIVPDLDNSTFFGEVVIDFEAERATQEIVLHAANLQIDYNKLVLTERRCTPPSLETTSVPTTSAPSPTPEFIALTTRPYVTIPATAATQSLTSSSEAPFKQEQSSSVTDKVGVEGSSTSAVEVAPSMPEEAPAMGGETPAMQEQASMMQEQAPAMQEQTQEMEVQAPAMQEQAPEMQEQSSMMQEQSPEVQEQSPAMQEQAPEMQEQAPAMQEQAPEIQEQSPMMQEQAPEMQEQAPAMQEQAPEMQEQAPAMQEEVPEMQEQVSAMQEQAPEMQEQVPATQEKDPEMQEQAAPAMVEAPAMSEKAPAMQEQSATPMTEEALDVAEQAPAMEEAQKESEKTSMSGEVFAMPDQSAGMPDEGPVGHDEVPNSHEEVPVLFDEALSMPDEAPISHDEALSVLEEAQVSHEAPSMSEEVPLVSEVINEKDEVEASATSLLLPEESQERTTTVKELPAETTTEKDTFNLAGEALKILEVLNRSDIPPFIKANLTDDDEMTNLSDESLGGQPFDRDYIDKVETRTDDLAIEDCQKIEVFVPPPANFVTAPREEETVSEQTTAGMFNSIRSALEQIVQTTLAPLLKNDQRATDDEKSTMGTPDEKTTTDSNPDGKTTIVPISDDKSDILGIIDEKSSGGSTLDKNSEIAVSTEGKPEIQITTDRKVDAENTTDGKTDISMTTEGKSEIMFTTEGKLHVEGTSYRKPDAVNANGESEAESITEEKPETVSTTGTYKTETVNTESFQREDTAQLPLSNLETTSNLLEKTTPVPITEKLAVRMRETTNMPTDPPVNIGTEWSIDSSESVTTEDIAYATKTTEKATEGTTEYLTTTTDTRKSRKRRAAPKRKKRPTLNRFKLKQSAKLPTCTSEDMYEVRVDKALSPIKRRTELESPDIGVEVAKDKIRQEDHDALVLPIKTPLKAGKRYRLTMSFSGKMSRRPVGLYRSDYAVEEGGRRKSKYVATTVFEPIHARRVFPCLDDPRFRARFSMRIAHPPNLSAYSNMPASTASDDVDSSSSSSSSGIPAGWLWDRFETSPPMPTYLVAFFVGALARKSRTAAGAPGQNNLMVRVLARRERLRDASFALNLAPKVMLEMGQWLNKPTSLSKLDLLALPGPGPDAVENWGLVSFQERYLLTQPGLLSRFSVASVVSHELAHDWFGNLVTPHHWKYAWLSEGLATYSSARILNKIQPTWDVEDLATVSAYITAMTSDDDDAIPMQPSKITTNNYRAVFSPSSYYKGYMTMRMLKSIIGDEMLTDTLRRYVQQNAFGWAKTSRLWAAVNETAREKSIDLNLPRSLPKLMASWIEEPGYPLVTITRNYTSGEVYVQQGRHTIAREVESNTTWWIPLRTWTAKTTGAMLQWIPPSSKRKAVRLTSPVPIGGDQWLMANAEFSGPMRVQYDLKNWDLLATALTNGDLPRGAGAQLSVDAMSLASNGQLPFSVALKVVSAALGARTGDAHLTWTAASPALRRIDRELRGTKASRPYRQWLHRLITPLDTWISFDARNDTVPDAVLARHVTTAACSLAMPLCLTTGRNQFRTWMASNAAEPRVPIELRGTLYCAAVRDGNSDTVWRYLWSKVATVSSDEKIRILKALGCTRDPDLAKRLLQLAADVKSPVYKKQLPTIVRSIATHDTGPGVVLSFLAENIQKFANDTKTLGRLIGEVAPAVNSKKDMKKLQGLLPQITTSRATMAKMSASATAAMERSHRLSQGIFAYFNKSKKTS